MKEFPKGLVFKAKIIILMKNYATSMSIQIVSALLKAKNEKLKFTVMSKHTKL